MFDDWPLETKDFNQYFEPSTYCLLSDDSSFDQYSQPSDIGERMSLNSSQEIDVSAKKYAFNPLSEPFQPKRIINSYGSSPISFTSDSSDCSAIESLLGETKESSIVEAPKEFVCILCPEIFASSDELTEHIKCKIQQPYRCVACSVSYDDNIRLQRHLKSHRRLKTFKCRGCSKKFRSLHQLNKHFELCRYKLYIFI